MSLTLIVAAVGWLSVRAIDADRAEFAAREQAALEENTRLALWRMDSAKASLVSDETTRPYFAYTTMYSAERAYGRMFNGKAAAAAPMVLSPLATQVAPEILVHFQFDADRRLTSPQVPMGKAREQTVPRFLAIYQVETAQRHLNRVKQLIEVDSLLAQLPALEAPLTELPLQLAANNGQLQSSSVSPSNLQPLPDSLPQANSAQQSNLAQQANPPQQAASSPRGNQRGKPTSRNPGQQGLYGSSNPPQNFEINAPAQIQVGSLNADNGQLLEQQRTRGDNEFQARSQYLANSVNSSEQRFNNYNDDYNRLVLPLEGIGVPASDVRSSRMVPRWINDELVLARRVSINGREYVQGCLLDWPSIKQELLDSIVDLLPEADLIPLTSVPDDGFARLLASVPARLVPGSISLAPPDGLSPTHQSLIVAWGSMLVGAVAVAVLLQGVVALSERRASFVSAVTHELRTPLTTFRMYAEMLSEGMVRDEVQQRKYLNTLRVEADRLTHLVENVLAYARLERGGPAGRIVPVSLSQILNQGADRLADRAEQAGLQMLVEADESTLDFVALADASAVEQVLFNLVDNACKYAVTATDKRLHLETEVRRGQLILRIRDHGPGIARSQRSRLFTPFHKSADDAAQSAPGVGLGLALSRRLARDMGGDLSYAETPDGGASFELLLKPAIANLSSKRP